MIKKILATFFMISLVGCNTENRNWSVEEKAVLCKHYIGDMFSKKVKIIDHYKTDEAGLVYVQYKRSSDGSLWSYSCSIKGDSMVWLSWLVDVKKWGRWRDEDRVSLKYDSSNDNMVVFTGPDTGKRIKVNL